MGMMMDDCNPGKFTKQPIEWDGTRRIFQIGLLIMGGGGMMFPVIFVGLVHPQIDDKHPSTL